LTGIVNVNFPQFGGHQALSDDLPNAKALCDICQPSHCEVFPYWR